MKDTTRSILIDPIAKNITNIELSCVDENEQIHKIIGCDYCCQVYLGGISRNLVATSGETIS
jgi:hypothetical protein